MKTPRYEDLLAEAKETHMLHASERWDRMLATVSSPIEKVFLAHLLFLWRWSGECPSPMADAIWSALLAQDLEPASESESWGYYRGDDLVACGTQWEIDLVSRRVRPDFAFVFTGAHASKVIVELDGHDFHERTPEQAQADKSRDRLLQAKGWSVLRFTGREILRAPIDCVTEVHGLLFARAIAQRVQGGEE